MMAYTGLCNVKDLQLPCCVIQTLASRKAGDGTPSCSAKPLCSTPRQTPRTDPSLTSAALPRSACSGSRLQTSAASGSDLSSALLRKRWKWSCAVAPCTQSWTGLPLACAPGCSCGWGTGLGGSSSAQPALQRPCSGWQVLWLDRRSSRFPAQFQSHCSFASLRWGLAECVLDRWQAKCWFLCFWVCWEKVFGSKTYPGHLCKVGI